MAAKKIVQKVIPVAAVRTQNSYSGWKPRVTKSAILICTDCKVKYIKTREPQLVCIKCMTLSVTQPIFRLKSE